MSERLEMFKPKCRGFARYYGDTSVRLVYRGPPDPIIRHRWSINHGMHAYGLTCNDSDADRNKPKPKVS